MQKLSLIVLSLLCINIYAQEEGGASGTLMDQVVDRVVSEDALAEQRLRETYEERVRAVDDMETKLAFFVMGAVQVIPRRGAESSSEARSLVRRLDSECREMTGGSHRRCVRQVVNNLRGHLDQEVAFLQRVRATSESLELPANIIQQLDARIEEATSRRNSFGIIYGNNRAATAMSRVGTQPINELVENLQSTFVGPSQENLEQSQALVTESIDSIISRTRSDIGTFSANSFNGLENIDRARRERLENRNARLRSTLTDFLTTANLHVMSHELAFANLSNAADRMGVALEELKTELSNNNELIERFDDSPIGIYVQKKIQNALDNFDLCTQMNMCVMSQVGVPDFGRALGNQFDYSSPDDSEESETAQTQTEE